MKKLIKFIFGLAVLFFVVVIAAVVILPLVISPNDYKPQIVEAVKQQTGRDLSIEGEIGLNVFPKIGLTLGQSELSNAKGFKGKTFAKVDAINIQVALMPLLDKQVKMDEVVLEGLVLNLQRNKSGTTNWADLAGKASVPEKKPKPKEKPSFEIAALAIGGVRIENARVHWQDDFKGQQYTVENFNLISGPLMPGDPVELELKTDFSSGQPKLQGQLNMNTTVMVSAKQDQFTLSPLKLGLDASGETLPGGRVQTELSTDRVVLHLGEQTLSVKGMSLDLLGVKMNGAIVGKAIMSDQPALNGHIQIQPFNAREVIKSLGQQVPETADPNVLTRVGATFDLSASPTQASLDKLTMQLDDTALTGNLRVSNFDSPAIGFDLNIDKIDLDRYLPASQEQPKDKSVAVAPPPSGTEAELFPVETLRKLNANGTARIGEVRRNNVTAKDVVVKVKAKGGNVNLKPSAKLYQGTYDADVTVDARPKVPQLNVDAKLHGVQIEPLLKDLRGEAKLAGRTDATVKVYAVGNTQSAVKKSLNGNAAFSFQDGALIGVNLAKLIREGLAKVQGKSTPKSNEQDKTDFSELKATAKITNGIVDNRDFSMKSPLLRLLGAGQADLVREELDYQLKASIVGSLQGQGGEDLSKLKGVTIPVRVTGPFDNPSYKPDLSAVLSDTVKQKAKEKIDEKKGVVKEKLQDKLKDKLKGLF